MSKPTQQQQEMIEKFQCPGCVSGSDTKCGSFEFFEHKEDFFNCSKHCPGTTVNLHQLIALGLPSGFNVCLRLEQEGGRGLRLPYIRLQTDKKPTFFTWLDIPVWYLEKDGYLFIKTYSPRTLLTAVEVYKGCTKDDIKLTDDVQFPRDVAESSTLMLSAGRP